LKGEIHAVSTAPINKEAIHKAGSPFPGHTEIFANLTGLTPKDVAMLLIAGKLRVFHVTAHESLRHACELTKKERVLETIKLAHKSLKDLGIEEPKIAVAGLNPHAGEGGLFGDEEIKEIAPAIKLANELGINAIGPFSPDSVFFRASKGEFDGVVAMYHDQGHIPLKLIGFTNGVNVTIGLPIIRTSVDHGTAFGRAGKGYADPTSMSEAIKLAATMSEAKCKHSK
jgi:4-hydroxythreonine-4-phosphate dehydrogenase